jgi:glycosyltransferase involved in cell wall biosynthesis
VPRRRRNRVRPSRPLRVALVSFDFGNVCVPLANGLAKEADVLLLLAEDHFHARWSEIDGRVHARPIRKARLRQPVRQIRVCRDLLRTIREFDPDVVHVQQGHLWFNFVLPLLRRRYPIVVTIHDPRPHLGDAPSRRTPQFAMDIAFNTADRLIVHAEALRQEVAREYGRTVDEVDVIPHVAPDVSVANGPEKAPEPVVLFFGRIWPYKGLEYLLQAEPMISAAIPDVRIIVAGEGEDLQRYRALIAEPTRVQFRNEYIPHKEVPALLREAAVVVAPYVDATQSGVIPLAYAAGRPVVATYVGALPEMVDDGIDGLLVPPRNSRALADAIVKILESDALWCSMSQAARRRADTDWSEAVVAKQTVASYEALLDQVCVQG